MNASRAFGVATLALAATVAGCASPPAAQAEPLNVLLISVDTLRADHLGCYGYERDTSPIIDALAEESIFFETCLSPLAATLPAHLSIFTGVYPIEHGILGNAGVLGHGKIDRGGKKFVSRPELRSFPEFARQAGYTTAGFVSGVPVSELTGMGVGFDHFDDPERSQRDAVETNAAVFAWLAEVETEPFFLFVHYYDPHHPYEPPEGYDLFGDDAWLGGYMHDRGIPESATRPNQVSLETRATINGYDGSIRYVDEQIGRLFARLRAKSLWDRTAVVLLSDHGEGLGEHGMIGHGYIHREQLQVPLMMRIPGETPRRVTRPISLVDVLPTLLGRIGEDPWRGFLDQASGVDALAVDAQPVFSQRSNRERTDLSGPSFTLTDGRWKYVHEPEGEDRLFDWTNDPYELHDRLGEQDGVVSGLRTVLVERLRDYGQRSQELGSTDPDVSTDPALLEQLRDLGYVD